MPFLPIDRSVVAKALVPIGKAVLAGIGFAINVFLSRHLGAETFGTYATVTAIVIVFAGIVQHVADVALLRLYHDTPPGDQAALFTADFWLRVSGAAFSVFLLVLTVAAIAAAGFKVPLQTAMTILACAAIAGTVIFSAAQIRYQATQRFSQYLRLDIILNFSRIAMLASAYLAGGLTALVALSIYAVSLFVSAAAVWPKGALARMTPDFSADTIAGRLLRGGSWIGLAFVFSILTGKLDILMLSFLGTSTQTGIYAAAINLALLAEFGGSFLLVVFYPNIMTFYRQRRLRHALLVFFAVMAPLAIAAGLLAHRWADPIFAFVFGAEYVQSADIFRILFPGTLFMALVHPIAAAFINMKAPRTLCLMEGAVLLGTSIAYPLLIGAAGANGAAIVSLAARLAAGSLILVWVFLNTEPKAEDDPVIV